MKEGECQQLVRSDGGTIGPSLAEVVRSADQYRSVQQQASVFDSTGFALEDHVAADMLLDYAMEFGLGVAVEIESISGDPQDPYGFRGPVQSSGVEQNVLVGGPSAESPPQTS